MKFKRIFAVGMVCFALSGFAFTTLFFFSSAQKMVLVEIQEEEGEDALAKEDDYENGPVHDWKQIILAQQKVEHFENIICRLISTGQTNPGFLIGLIKPPMT